MVRPLSVLERRAQGAIRAGPVKGELVQSLGKGIGALLEEEAADFEVPVLGSFVEGSVLVGPVPRGEDEEEDDDGEEEEDDAAEW